MLSKPRLHFNDQGSNHLFNTLISHSFSSLSVFTHAYTNTEKLLRSYIKPYNKMTKGMTKYEQQRTVHALFINYRD